MILTLSVDIFTAMCVLCILEGLTNDKSSLLQESVDNLGEKSCLGMGMEFLQAASPSSRLVARYIAILQQLRGEYADEIATNSPEQANNAVQYASTGSYNNVATPEDFQGDTSWWATYFPENTFGMNFDLGSLNDASSSGIGTFRDFTLGSVPNDFSAAHASW